MVIPSFSILLVDRFDRFRHLIRSILIAEPGFQVVGEASNGLEAVRKTEELKPDLILLDFVLPFLNGIEAARQIRKVAPKSKVLFLTQASDLSVVQEALKDGALGHVLKANVVTELLAAVAAVTSGKRFVSGGTRP